MSDQTPGQEAQGGDAQTQPPAGPQPGGQTFHPITSQDQLERVLGHRLAQQERGLTERLTDQITQRVQAQLEQDYAPVRQELDTLRTERETAKRAAMTDAERKTAEVADLQAKADRLELELAKREAVNQVLITQQRVAQLQRAAATLAPGLPVSIYQTQMEGLAGKPDFTLEAGMAAVKQWGDEYRASLEALGLPLKPTSIGSAGAPPAAPSGDTDTELEDLLTRSDGTGPAAVAAAIELEKRFAGR